MEGSSSLVRAWVMFEDAMVMNVVFSAAREVKSISGLGVPSTRFFNNSASLNTKVRQVDGVLEGVCLCS